MKPESVLEKLLAVDSDGDPMDTGYCPKFGYIDIGGDDAEAVHAACQAYPLALKLAEAAEDVMALASGRVRSCGCLAECVHTHDNLSDALAAFLAHRTPAQHDEKGGEQ